MFYVKRQEITQVPVPESEIESKRGRLRYERDEALLPPHTMICTPLVELLAIRLRGKAAKSLVIPQGEGTGESVN